MKSKINKQLIGYKTNKLGYKTTHIIKAYNKIYTS